MTEFWVIKDLVYHHPLYVTHDISDAIDYVHSWCVAYPDLGSELQIFKVEFTNMENDDD